MQLPSRITWLFVTIKVSVPSIGSKAVQRPTRPAICNCSPCFSTLYRVEGCAAQAAGLIGRMSLLFQSPLSGRRLCSVVSSAIYDAANEVSVPSIGSKAVQLPLPPAAGLKDSVSVPSIGSKAVQRRPGLSSTSRDFWVSVPSIGSKAVQLAAAFRTLRNPRRFSTLYRVEGCAA